MTKHRAERIEQVAATAVLFSDDGTRPEDQIERAKAYLYGPGDLYGMDGVPITTADVEAFFETLGEEGLAAFIGDLDSAREQYHRQMDDAVSVSDAKHAHRAEVDRWEVMNQAAGGDLFSNKDKIAAMRRVDEAGMPWEAYSAAVLAEVERVSSLSPAAKEEQLADDKATYMARIDDTLQTNLEAGRVTEEKAEELRSWYESEFDAEHSQPQAAPTAPSVATLDL